MKSEKKKDIPKGIYLNIVLQPNSSKTQICGFLGEALKIKVAAPPTKNKANIELIKFLSKLFKAEVIITKGQKSKHKTIFIKENIKIDEIIKKEIENSQKPKSLK